jgi:hypothetical protein
MKDLFTENILKINKVHLILKNVSRDIINDKKYNKILDTLLPGERHMTSIGNRNGYNKGYKESTDDTTVRIFYENNLTRLNNQDTALVIIDIYTKLAESKLIDLLVNQLDKTDYILKKINLEIH